MKRFLGVAFLLLVAKAGFATGVPQLTYQTAISSITMAVVSVSTSSALGATQMDNPQLGGRVVTEIQNIDSSANLWCLAFSTAPVANGGRKIAAGGAWVISIADKLVQAGFPQTSTAVKLWCLSDGSGAATKAIVTQEY